ncbi:MAG: hypothetical protein ACE5GW_08300, partial [Planctomycetota bacterium]
MGKDQRSRRKSGTEQRVFRAESFFTTKEWVYFCLEYDLEICDGCRARARRRKTSAPAAGPIPWFCEGCTPPRRRPPRAMNGELWEAIRSRTNVRGRCELCEQQISFKECWVSDDCRRLYCSRHLRRLATPDRFRLARRHLRRWSRRRAPPPRGRA